MIAREILLGCLVSTWAVYVYAAFRHGSVNQWKRLNLWLVSFAACLACLFLFSQVRAWELIWIRWSRHDFCALPGHSALRWIFIEGAPFAFVSPALAYLALRLARTIISKGLSFILLFTSVLLVAGVIHGLFWPTDW